MAEFGWPPGPPEVQPACCLDLRKTVVVDGEPTEEQMPFISQLLYGRWYPVDGGFAYAHPVEFVVDTPEIQYLPDGRVIGGARVERCWLRWPDSIEVTIPLGSDAFYISGPASKLSLFPIAVPIVYPDAS